MRESDEPLTYRDRLWLGWFTVWVLVTVLFVTSCSACGKYRSELPTTSNPAVAQLVKVVDGKAKHCTVFKVGDERAVTAGHCCGSEEDPDADLWALLFDEVPEKHVITYHAQGPHAVPGAAFTVLWDDDEHDICILRGRLRGVPLQLAAHDPALGARVWTAGYPKSDLLFSDGLWSGRDGSDEGKASIAVWGGASGSPVMDTDGRVVGVLRAFKSPMSNMAFIAPLEWLRHGLMMAN